MKRITDIIAYCEDCDWRGTVGDCEGDEHDGNLLCPKCDCFVRTELDDIREARGPVAGMSCE